MRRIRTEEHGIFSRPIKARKKKRTKVICPKTKESVEKTWNIIRGIVSKYSNPKGK